MRAPAVSVSDPVPGVSIRVMDLSQGAGNCMRSRSSSSIRIPGGSVTGSVGLSGIDAPVLGSAQAAGRSP
ncbi:hypothetical protein GCM10017687_82460 [Streptomyces echinatus]